MAKGKPKRDGSGKGIEANKGRGCGKATGKNSRVKTNKIRGINI